eukprot:TRINITY_DN3162_c0_g1_i1.p4 TRINITY_DN3162_c0_g1~~TRINITY_DN3162_c0_g1_i1.p4  ORF type:complete len:171 (-),score=13.09 TRINITY_DN3162_c0_g1_i1:586-1098(-)
MNYLLNLFFMVGISIIKITFLKARVNHEMLNYAPTKSKLDYIVLQYAPTWLDYGYDWGPKGLIDVNGDGRIDYCRAVGPNDAPYIGCDLGIPGVDQDQGYRTPANIDLGYQGRPRGFVDANGDGYGDFCRCVGNAPYIFVSCALGSATGFDRGQYSYMPPCDPAVMCAGY